RARLSKREDPALACPFTARPAVRGGWVVFLSPRVPAGQLPAWAAVRRPGDREGAMTVQLILNVKGSDVVSVLPDERVSGAVATMMQHGIGAVLVRDEIGAVLGILSERDIV